MRESALRLKYLIRYKIKYPGQLFREHGFE